MAFIVPSDGYCDGRCVVMRLMPKSIHRTRPLLANPLNSRTPRADGADPSSDTPAPLNTRHQSLLDRILDTPHLARVVPRLQPELLHRVIQTCGLEDCGDLVALATPDQLARIFDLDLWRTAQPGLDEKFDADRFGVWLEVMGESGATVAAQKLAEMDVDLVIAGHAHRFSYTPPGPGVPHRYHLLVVGQDQVARVDGTTTEIKIVVTGTDGKVVQTIVIPTRSR